MKKILFSLMIVAAFLQPVKKAEAGVILTAAAFATGGVTGAGLLFVGGGMGAIGAPVSAVIGLITKEYHILWFSLGLLVLDNDSYRVEEFKTIPPYMMDEIRYQTKMKAESLEFADGVKRVVFTDEEVDVIFELADESTSSEELIALRDAMTASF